MRGVKKDRAAEYVLGLLSPAERYALVREAGADPALAGEIAAWDERLAPLSAGDEVTPPPDMLARIEAAIAARQNDLPGTTTIRAHAGDWQTLAPGIEQKMLWNAGPQGRVTVLMRMAPGARYPSHEHADDEECYVVSGDLTFDTLTLRAGDYHLARRGIAHPPASSAGGCLLLITAAV